MRRGMTTSWGRRWPRAAARVDRFLHRSPLPSLFRWRAARDLAVIAYHGIEDPENFARHLGYLRQHAHTVTLEEVSETLEGRTGLPRHAVLITFDDADRSVLELGLPALAEWGFPAVAFVIAGHLDGDRPFWWTEVEDLVRAGGTARGLEGLPGPEVVRRLKTVPEERRRAAMADIRRTSPVPAPSRPQLRSSELGVLASAGIAIGNHTMTHPCLPRCSDRHVRREVEEAHALLRSAVGSDPTAFAYPNGDWDPRAERLVRDLGYRTAFLFDHALVRRGARHPLRISRVRVNSTTRVERLGLILSGLHPSLHRLRARVTGSPAR